MSFVIAGIPVPGPGDVVEAGRSAAGWGVRTAETVAGLPERTEAMLDQMEQLIRRVERVASHTEAVLARVDAVTGAAEKAVGTANSVAGQAAGVVDQAGRASKEATDLLAKVGPMSQRALPLADTFIRELTEAEVIAAVRLVDTLPRVTESMQNDILPMLTTLRQVGPDINELLGVTKDLRGLMGGIPVLNSLLGRGDRDGKRDQDRKRDQVGMSAPDSDG